MNGLFLIVLVSLIQSPQFDMQGTIIRVNSPSSLVIGNDTVNKTVILDGVDSSGLNNLKYNYLMRDLQEYLPKKSVLVNGTNVYFDLVGSYNARSINDFIENKISDLEEMPDLFCEGYDCWIYS
ncbi:MAG TPA: hypothetical protein PKY20_02580 [Methanothrix sp.]|nr:hypothetical protein [Methanothrix sp.]HQE97059.1 hypothetical protein [Methanothrix sp.]HQJ80262.1 hypothetical protein [Methanothrix sp.]HUM80197.1 hypothetical protein [Methanothrix sp.]